MSSDDSGVSDKTHFISITGVKPSQSGIHVVRFVDSTLTFASSKAGDIDDCVCRFISTYLGELSGSYNIPSVFIFDILGDDLSIKDPRDR